MKSVTEIKTILIKGRIDEALGEMQTLPISDAELERTINQVRAQHEIHKLEVAKGVLNKDEEWRFRNQILAAVFCFLDEIETRLPVKPKPHRNYLKGIGKMIQKDYQSAANFFGKVPITDPAYLSASLNKCLAKRAMVRDENDIYDLFRDLNTLEEKIWLSSPTDWGLLEKLLYNRLVMYKELKMPKLAAQDLQKLKTLGSSLALYH